MQLSQVEVKALQGALTSASVSKVAGVLKCVSTGRTPNWNKIHQDYANICMLGQAMPSIHPDQIAAVAAQIVPEASTAGGGWNPTLKNAATIEDLIDNGIEHYGITLGPNGESIRRGGVDIAYDVFESCLKEFCREYEEDSKIPGTKDTGRKVFQAARLGDALKVYINNTDIRAREKLRNSIYYRQEFGAKYTAYYLIKKVLEIWDVKEDHELSTVMMMQWMWQTKRYAMGLEVLEPMMINFMGSAQGTMKTSFIEALTTPFKAYRKPDAKLKEVLDEREYTLWAKKYVVIFDELQKGRLDRKEMGSLITAMKSLLTAKSVGGRVMKTTHHIEMQRIFSPIASSNSSIVSVIRDKTGMRRFYEMNVMTQTRAPEELIPIVEALKDMSTGYADMVWSSIDESIEDGYMEQADWKSKLMAVQDTYQIVDNVDLWIESGDIKDIPVQRDRFKDKHLQEHVTKLMDCRTKKDVIALNGSISPMSWQLDYDLTKEATEWVEDTMGKQAAQFVGSREHMVQFLEGRNSVVVSSHNHVYVLCESQMAMDTGTSAGGI